MVFQNGCRVTLDKLTVLNIIFLMTTSIKFGYIAKGEINVARFFLEHVFLWNVLPRSGDPIEEGRAPCCNSRKNIACEK